MAEQRTIYVVTSGEYPYPKTVGIFDDEELAKSFATKFKCNPVESYVLNPHEKEIRQGYNFYYVSMERDGMVHIVRPDDPTEWMDESDCIYEADDESPFTLTCRRWAKDEQHAIKIVNEKRTRLIADNKFVEGWWEDANV